MTRSPFMPPPECARGKHPSTLAEWNGVCIRGLACHEPQAGARVNSQQARVERIRDLIKTYLADHPGAADTVNGVLSFWLPAACSDATLADVARALGQLVDEGYLAQSELPGGPVLYERARVAGNDRS